MKFQSADHAVRTYLALHDRVGSIRAMNPGQYVKEPLAGPCRRTRRKGRGLCGGKVPHRTRFGDYVCCACGRPWRTRTVVEGSGNSGEKTARPPDEASRLMIATIGLLLSRLSDLSVWHERAIITWARLTMTERGTKEGVRLRALDRIMADAEDAREGARPMAILARMLARADKRPLTAWPERRVLTLLREARDQLRRELHSKELLA